MLHDVRLPERVDEPLKVRDTFWRPRVSRADGAELPVDRWGNRTARGPDGRPVRVRVDAHWSQFAHALRVNDDRVPIVPPLPTAARVVLVGYVLLGLVTLWPVGPWLHQPAAWAAARVLRAGGSRARRYATAAALLVATAVAVALVGAGLDALFDTWQPWE